MDWSSFSIGNAAGFIKGPGLEFDDALASAATDITLGSITLEPRAGNPGNVYWYGENGTSINSLGLPNPGIQLTTRYLPELFRKAEEFGKRLRVSIAGFSPDEYRQLARHLYGCGSCFHEIEVNLGCPNVWTENGQKPIAAFNPELVKNILLNITVGLKLKTDSRLSLKLSPYSDPSTLLSVADVIKNGAKLVHSVVTSNTFPNGLAFVGKKRAIDVPYGEVGGSSLRYIALGQVAQFAEALKDTGISVVGVGGITSGEDVVAMLAAGAAGVQVGTAFGERRGKVFSDIGQELIEIAE